MCCGGSGGSLHQGGKHGPDRFDLQEHASAAAQANAGCRAVDVEEVERPPGTHGWGMIPYFSCFMNVIKRIKSF